MLVPPDNFGMVEPGIYRCSKLEADHLPFLETLKLTSLILLDVAKPPRTLKAYLTSNSVSLYSLGGLKISNHQTTGSPGEEVDSAKLKRAISGSGDSDRSSKELQVVSLGQEKSNKNDSWMIIEKNLIVAAFEILLDRSKHSVLLVDSTSALVGILRKIQKWNFHSIVNEYRIFTGNASKISYNVEVFLEQVRIELVSYELDHAIRKRDEPLNTDSILSKNSISSSRRISASQTHAFHGSSLTQQTAPARSYYDSFDENRPVIDENRTVSEDDDAVSWRDYEDGMDEDELSASPQIPANLLKLVEQRATNGALSPGTSPEYRIPSGSNSRSNSLDLPGKPAPWHRRKSSVESRYVRSNNSRFKDPSLVSSPASSRRASIDVNLRQFRLEHEKSTNEEVQRAREQFGYKYYQATDAGINDVSVIRLRLPSESSLPAWFINGRNFWEKHVKC